MFGGARDTVWCREHVLRILALLAWSLSACLGFAAPDYRAASREKLVDDEDALKVLGEEGDV